MHMRNISSDKVKLAAIGMKGDPHRVQAKNESSSHTSSLKLHPAIENESENVKMAIIRTTDGEGLLRWGGWAGILSAFLFILTAVTLLLLVPEAETVEESIHRFPENRSYIALGESLYLAVVILWVPLLLALSRSLRVTDTAPALIGSGLGFIGLASLAVGALPFIAFTSISELYHSPGITSIEKSQLIALWQTTQDIFNETDTVGYILIASCFIVLGISMLGSPNFGKSYCAISMASGAAALIGIAILGVESDLVFPFVLITFVVYPLFFGMKLRSLSKVTNGWQA
jgi:uncharacterized membrane protein